MTEDFVFDDGGRAAAGFKGSTGDCVTRSIAIATGKPYREVYDDLAAEIRAYRAAARSKVIKGRSTSPRDGVPKPVIRRYLERLGWTWHPTMQIGSGTQVHLHADELPRGRVIVQVSKHITTMIDGVIHDTFDPRRGGWINPNGPLTAETRAVYGYWLPEGIGS